MTKRKLKFLLTPGGGPGILAQVASLRQSDRYTAHIILADCNPASGNLFLPEVDSRFSIPPCDDSGFVKAMADFIRREGVDYWYSGLDEELPVIARHRAVFENAGCKLLLPSVESIEAALDKKQTHTLTSGSVRSPRSIFLHPDSELESLWSEFSGNLLFKVVDSRGGRNIFIPSDIDEFRFYSRRVRKLMHQGLRFMVQEVIKGDEYNVSMLHDADGRPLYAVSRRKFETREVKSTTTAAVIEKNQAVIDQALQAVASMNLYPGFNNVETIVSHDNGEPYFIEVNGGRAAAQDMNLVAAGVPMMDLMVALIEEEQPEAIDHPPDGKAILKIRKDVIVDFGDIENVKSIQSSKDSDLDNR